VKTEVWFIGDLCTAYEGRLRKLRIQRKRRWLLDQSKKYIQFISTLENTCLPISVNELQMVSLRKVGRLHDKLFLVSNLVVEYIQ